MTTHPDPSDHLDPDRDLMRRVAAGDHAAFRDLVERHQQLVVGMVARMIGSADAEDIAQQVFLNVWKSAPRWRPEAKALTWMLTIAKRLVFNESRRRSRSRIVRQTESDEETPEFPDQAPTPDQSLRDAELHTAVEKAMASLGEKERMAVILRRHEGMPYEEIASILGMSVPAVKSLLFRARTSLRHQLSGYLGG
jgi:RNA polymerase sigma-70 factor (ECF subfamily)